MVGGVHVWRAFKALKLHGDMGYGGQEEEEKSHCS